VSSDDAKAGVSDLGRLLRVTGPDTQKQRIDISAVTEQMYEVFIKQAKNRKKKQMPPMGLSNSTYQERLLLVTRSVLCW
jgi:hypothetical protein